MIKLEVNLISFCVKHDLPFNKIDKCRKCGMEVKLDQPVISKDWVGVESEIHEPCGEPYKITLLRNRNKNIFDE